MENYSVYYDSIIKPFFAPPPEVFGIAWGIIYPLMAIAGVYLLVQTFHRQLPPKLLVLFLVNLVFNLAFTPILFGAENIIWATVDIYLVLGTLLWLEVLAWKKAKIVFWLLAPYILWGVFATILQTSILLLN